MTQKQKDNSVARDNPLYPIFHDWSQMSFKHGIAPTKVFPTQFVDPKYCPGWDSYWRDVPSRKSMDVRVDAYRSKLDLRIDERCYRQAVSTVCDLFSSHYKDLLSVASVDEATKRLPTSTAAGYPFSQGVRKGEVSNQLKKLAKFQWTRVHKKRPILVGPCRAGARRQIREKGVNKPRLIWAYPGYLNILETQFTLPFMDNPPPFLGWSVNYLDYGRTLNTLQRSLTCSVGHVDFSAFDSTVISRLIRSSFKIVKAQLSLGVDESKLFDQLVEYFVHTPLIYYDKVLTKHRGIPSGSAFTQLVGSICNMIACYYASFRGRRYNIQNTSKWLGDDSLLYFDEGMAREDWRDYFLSYFIELGLNVSEDKTGFTNSTVARLGKGAFKFLGREITYKWPQLLIDRNKLSAQIMWPEERDRTQYDTASRLIGLAWAYGFTKPIYALLFQLFNNLKVENSNIKIRRSVKRFANIFLTKDINLTRFPEFDEIQLRYYGGLDKYVTVQGKSSWSIVQLTRNVIEQMIA